MKALIRVGRIFTGEPVPEGETTRYQRGALRILPGRAIPVIVDHNLERQIGVVDEIIELDCADGPWLAARCTCTRRRHGCTKAGRYLTPIERGVL